jgi:hypothetical protein
MVGEHGLSVRVVILGANQLQDIASSSREDRRLVKELRTASIVKRLRTVALP